LIEGNWKDKRAFGYGRIKSLSIKPQKSSGKIKYEKEGKGLW
jgi:hypothetical protein